MSRAPSEDLITKWIAVYRRLNSRACPITMCFRGPSDITFTVCQGKRSVEMRPSRRTTPADLEAHLKTAIAFASQDEEKDKENASRN